MQCNAMQIPESFLEIFRIFSLIPAILKFQNICLSINLLHLLVWALSGSFSLNFTWKFSRIVLFCNFYYMDMMHWWSPALMFSNFLFLFFFPVSLFLLSRRVLLLYLPTHYFIEISVQLKFLFWWSYF